MVPLMHFSNYVWFEHTQRNVPEQCVNLLKLKPENSWTQKLIMKQSSDYLEILNLVKLQVW